MRSFEVVPSLPVAPAAEPAPLRVVAAGGGTGLPRVLAGLAPGVEPEEGRPVAVTALVTTADDGGSSGALRLRYGVPAVGDARNCLVALTSAPNPLAALFQHRFGRGDGDLAGHTVGNLVLAALAERLGDLSRAVSVAGKLLGARGRVLPAAEGPVELLAELADGRLVRGERAIAAARGEIAALRLAGPAPAPAEALEAIRAADLVVLGPGSLWSSVIASLLGGGVAEALRATRATRVLVVNLFTEPGETDGCTAAEHVAAVQEQLGDVVDVALVHRPPLPASVVAAAAARGGKPVAVDRAEIEGLGVVPVVTDLLEPRGSGRHDPQKLARALLAIARAR
ncbi:gluconeogenesis factor YvcK family protein [Anaeromyxobacter oryzisoli]|uniref:gluconeogenesis factor YvcK family protein n=1 Tax=Anaeromyxobacter oryzisoli TaxID=2925408 RepID=UPI001F564940|nr:gluconeogenesis factor YvcK family protein [Anaeromyxobacter sp. SG63]